MKARRWLALVSISLAVHAALVLAVGGLFARPDTIIMQPIAVELAHTVSAPSATPSSTALPTSSAAQSEPASAVAPEPTTRPAKPRPKLRPASQRPPDVQAAPTEPRPAAAAVPETAARSLPAQPTTTLTRTESAGGSIVEGFDDVPAEPGGAAQVQNASILQAWLAAIRARIEAAKRYPFAAEQRGMQGCVTVNFRLSPEGRLLGTPSLATSSGFGMLDNAALRAVRQAAPFPRFPGPASDVPTGPLSVELKFTLR